MSEHETEMETYVPETEKEECAPAYAASITVELTRHHKYVGTFKHLNESEFVGYADVYAAPAYYTDLEDMCEPTTRKALLQFTQLETTFPIHEIEQAIGDSLSRHGCHHDYDCCGCASIHARAKHVAGVVYAVTISTSRNF